MNVTHANLYITCIKVEPVLITQRYDNSICTFTTAPAVVDATIVNLTACYKLRVNERIFHLTTSTIQRRFICNRRQFSEIVIQISDGLQSEPFKLGPITSDIKPVCTEFFYHIESYYSIYNRLKIIYRW